MTITNHPAAGERMSATDAERLVTAAAAGDERAWNDLVDHFGAMLWAIARAHRLNDADAADVAQATWCKLVDHLGGLHDPGRVGAWLATTARRECLRILRGARTTMPCGDDLPDIPAPDGDPDDHLILDERDAALWRAFARLRASDRGLLGLLLADPAPSYDEISAALAIPVGSIGPTRARALRRLRHELMRAGAGSLVGA